ncbi:hypothetical protein [Deinococcus cellulosilyticus]|nr:hypothetical protein [Deinococcus cellulosilyticus]
MEAAREYAGEAHRELVPLTERLAKATGGKAEPRESLKSEERIQRKLDMEYQGDFTRVVDISGSRIIYKTLNKLYKGLAYMLEAPELQGRIVRFKDRFAHPAPSGYRDILMNLKMSNGAIVEMRLEIEAFNKAAKEEHNYYKESEMLLYQLEIEHRAPTFDEAKRLRWLSAKAKEIYAEAWKDVIIRNYKGVQDADS